MGEGSEERKGLRGGGVRRGREGVRDWEGDRKGRKE